MSLGIELKKLKRTGYFPAFLAGGLVAAAFPAIYMGVKAETLAPFSGNPVQLLMTATWQMSAMLNMLISICGACMMYHTEYANNGMQKMLALPVRQNAVFFGKFVIAAAALALMTIMEIAALAGCAQYWFTKNALDVPELLKTAGFQIIAALPTVMLMLIIASACKNMWVSLGIGVILVFTFSIFPQDNALLSLFPFSSPYQIFYDAAEKEIVFRHLSVCIVQTAVLAMAEVLYLKMRRCFE